MTSYCFIVIKTFADKKTRELFITGKLKRLQPDLLKRAIRRLEYIDLATCLDDLKVPPSNRLHALKGKRKGQYSISINANEISIYNLYTNNLIENFVSAFSIPATSVPMDDSYYEFNVKKEIFEEREATDIRRSN